MLVFLQSGVGGHGVRLGSHMRCNMGCLRRFAWALGGHGSPHSPLGSIPDIINHSYRTKRTKQVSAKIGHPCKMHYFHDIFDE